MVTQLQDIANQVAQEKISNSRLRNEEIRRQMTKPWSEPVQPTTTIASLQNATKGDKTLAGTYSALLNNWQGMSGSDDTDREFSGQYSGSANLPRWAPTAVGTGLSMAGMGAPVSALGSAATSLVRGDRAGAVGTLSNLFANSITGGKVPGIGGLAGTLASGIVGDRSAKEIGQGLFNSGLGTLFGVANPVAGLGYGLARMVGFDPAYGFNNMFGDGLEGVAPGFEGTMGGFFGKNALGSGISDNSSSSGNTPMGYSPTDLGSGISTTSGQGYSDTSSLGGGISGGLSDSYGW